MHSERPVYESGPVNGRQAVGYGRGQRDELTEAVRRPLILSNRGENVMQRLRLRNPRKDGEPFALLLEKVDDRNDPKMLQLRLEPTSAPETLQRIQLGCSVHDRTDRLAAERTPRRRPA